MARSLFQKIALRAPKTITWMIGLARKLPRFDRSKRGLYIDNTSPLCDRRTPGLWRRPISHVIVLGALSSALLLLAACAGGAIMTRSDFDNIEMGTPVTEVVQKYGSPVKIKDNKNGTMSYEYIERLPIGEQTVQENNYFLIIRDGKVVGKRYNEELPPEYDEIYEEDPNAVIN
jgi:hypothetical protein